MVLTSYFDRTPYVEQDGAGETVYVEHHRTMGDRVRDLVGAGFRLLDVVEPEWPEWNEQEWGGWSPLRGGLIPGTAIFVCERDETGGQDGAATPDGQGAWTPRPRSGVAGSARTTDRRRTTAR